MSYSIEEFNPLAPILFVDNIEIEFSLITLHKENYFAKTYGSLQNAIKKLDEDPNEIFNISWQLIDKKLFKNDFKKWLNFLFEADEPKEKIGEKLVNCFHESISNSMALIKNIDRTIEANKIKGMQTDGKPCYVLYYDRLAKRYGYSINDFYNLTLRQVHLLLKVSDDEAYKELETQAMLNNKKLKERIKINDVSVEEEKQQDAQAQDALKELQRRYKEGLKDGR